MDLSSHSFMPLGGSDDQPGITFDKARYYVELGQQNLDIEIWQKNLIDIWFGFDWP